MPKSTLINLQAHDIAIRRRGETIWYYPHRQCTCGAAQKSLARTQDEAKLSQDVFRARLSCPICFGTGYWWADPIKIKAAITEVQAGNAKDLLAAGLAAPGDLILNPPPLGMRSLQFNDFDKVLFPHRGGQPYTGDVLVRGQFSDGALWDLLAYPAAVVEAVTWHNPGAAEPVVITAEDGTDYTWERYSNRITWLADGPNVPPEGVPYSVRYRVYYEWIAFTSPFIRVESDNLLAPRVLLRKKHIIWS